MAAKRGARGQGIKIAKRKLIILVAAKLRQKKLLMIYDALQKIKYEYKSIYNTGKVSVT